MPPKVRDVIRRLEREGWEHIRTRGSHRTFKHPERADIVTIAGHPNDEIQAGTWNNVQKQAGWKQEPPQ
jgi:predicted RNA binding protein YcfA (HicA-like mRNA interferase family)